MTQYLIRTDLTAAATAPTDTLLLDWAPGRTSATIQFGNRAGTEFFTGWRAPREALDLFLLGASLYCADKTALRSPSSDMWTREVSIELPVQDEGAWRDAQWDKALNFLTGDRWTITPYGEQRSPLEGMRLVPDDVTPVGDIDAVSLFSGGLDSLTGVIDLLEEDPDRRLCLISHNEGDQASTAQKKLLAKLRSHYGEERLKVRRLFLRPAPATKQQARPLPEYRETTTRSRSMLFLTAGLALAASVGPDVPVYIPENGFIGINVPLTRARSGSYSTRTTHPYFIEMLQAAAQRVGVSNPDPQSVQAQNQGRDPRGLPQSRTTQGAGAR